MDVKFKNVINTFPDREKRLFDSVPEYLSREIQEIRFRSGRPVELCTANSSRYITDNLVLTDDPSDGARFDSPELAELFASLCSYSVYSRQDEIRRGFLTLPGGSRAGICGTAVYDGGRLSNIRDISSINIRISGEHIGSSDELFSENVNLPGGLLLCGAPCSGKTTVLRDLARAASEKFKTVIVDTRCELAGTLGGTAGNDIGMCDVLSGFERDDGIELAVRCMSPDIVICDELAGKRECDCVRNARNCGVSVIATAHCADEDELLRRKHLSSLVTEGVFRTLAFLKGRREAGKINHLCGFDELRG